MSHTFDIIALRKAMETIAVSLRKQDFLTYFKKFSLTATTDTMIQLGVNSAFHRDNIASKFYNEIKEAVQEQCKKIDTIDIVVDEMIDMLPSERVIDCRDLFSNLSKQLKKEQVHSQIHGVEVVEGINSRLINDKYKLENFII